MKYAVVGPTYPYRGGIAHYTTRLVHHLRERNTVRFFTYSRQYPAWLFPGKTDHDPSRQIVEESSERTIDALNPLSWWRTARAVARDKPDVLLLQWWTPFWMPLLLVFTAVAHRARIPVLYFCHQFVEPDSSSLEWFFARLALRWGDGYIVLTSKEYDMARRAFPGKPIRSGYLPVNDAFPHEGLSQTEARHRLGMAQLDGPLLLFAGFVRRYKGLRYLLQAMAYVPARVSLLVAGDFWEDEQEYRRLIQELGLGERVIIHNQYIPNEALEPYFAAADALVLPYISGSQSAVGMHGIYFGLPIIATAIGGLAESIEHEVNGLIVPPADSQALASAINRFLDEDLAQSFRAAALRARDRLSWPALIDIVEDISDELASAPRFGSGRGHDPSIRPDPGIQRG
jgi:glycosyltransferase involved in cell wall biosynthesis